MPASGTGAATELASHDVAAVDFGQVGIGRPLDELLAAVPGYESRVSVVNPLDRPWRSGPDPLGEHGRHAVGQLLERGLRAEPVVLGQCASAVYTLRLAAQLAEAGHPPRVVALVEPVLASPAVIDSNVHDLVGRLGGGSDVAAAIVRGLPPGGDLAELAEAVDAGLRVVGWQRVGALNIDKETALTVVNEIVGRYVDWICFLAAQAAEPHSAFAGTVRVVGAIADGVDALRRTAPAARVLTGPRQSQSAIAADMRAIIRANI